MSFTGKSQLKDGVEDLSDIVGIVSPYETPLLDHLGDAQRPANSTKHEWLEDVLLPSRSMIGDGGIDENGTSINVADGLHFRIGDQVQPTGSREVMLVTGIRGEQLTLVRGYGNTTPEPVDGGAELRILGNAALEGGDHPAARFTNRERKSNYTQVFTANVEVHGSQLSARQLAMSDELDYQKAERLRELLRDLENCVINGTPNDGARGNRAMQGIIPMIRENRIEHPGPALDEAILNDALRKVWERGNGQVDTIVVSGFQKRRINQFVTAGRRQGDTRFQDLVSIYESDFGFCRVVLSRWVPRDDVLLLDSSRIEVKPLAGRSFHFRKLAMTGDREGGQVTGEYTLELRNESSHGVISGLATDSLVVSA